MKSVTGELLTTSRAALALGVARETVVLWEGKGILPALRTTNGQRLFLSADVARLKEERQRSTEGGGVQ